ncbi:MAG: response regulator [Solirubrobacteraceae bacterium]|nr:response regulator [Solirubrobacteraceae bacterium]
MIHGSDGPMAVSSSPVVAATAFGSSARVVLVDDEPANLSILRRLLARAGYEHVRAFAGGEAATEHCLDAPPDLLLLDLHMPGTDGFAVLQALAHGRTGDGHFPVLVLTADLATDSRLGALAAGADDFLTKPVDPLETLLRVRSLLSHHELHSALIEDRSRLETLVQARTADLERARTEALEQLALASEYRDDETHQHARRIGRLSRLVAERAGYDEAFAGLLERAAPLHDIGKLAVPDAILLKPGPLDPGERSEMQLHTVRGGEILGGSRSPIMQLAEQIALSHHERWDGQGYPSGLAGAAIPDAARIVALVDVFDALVHERPYKRAWSVGRAIDEIASRGGTQFDPELLDVFLSLDHEALTS